MPGFSGALRPQPTVLRGLENVRIQNYMERNARFIFLKTLHWYEETAGTCQPECVLIPVLLEAGPWLGPASGSAASHIPLLAPESSSSTARPKCGIVKLEAFRLLAL
jgi:hypothetical protein